MTFVPGLDADAPVRSRVARVLDPIEIRILGSLMEKQLSTPEYYPLTLHALTAASNQKSNRDPVMELSESQVQSALERLQQEKLIFSVMGGRAVRFEHNLDSMWSLNHQEKALLTLLFLRGPQTSGELRGRSDRLHRFEGIAAVEEVLRDMAAHSQPLVRQLLRRRGQKEDRWVHLVAEVAEAPDTQTGEVAPAPLAEPLSARLARLEEKVTALEEALRALKQQLGG